LRVFFKVNTQAAKPCRISAEASHKPSSCANPHISSHLNEWQNIGSVKKTREIHGTAFAIELVAENFNSLGCRIPGNKSDAKEMKS